MQADQQRIQDIQTQLTSLGVQSTNYEVIHALLIELKQLESNIAAERGEQFFTDAFQATAGMGLSREMVANVAAYMRQFAERIVGSAIVQNVPPNASIPNVIDHIPPAHTS